MTLEVYAIGMCTREMGQGRTGRDAVGAGDQERDFFGNIVALVLVARGLSFKVVFLKKNFFLDDDAAARDFEGGEGTTR